ncbi:L-lysine 2,3-aminomutase [Plasticicumulans lactativorans]|uniref:L-lysine 2,3-aminomutase n=1 Tax=Plasticicumulans lactativorans TaxID=1133106 RepID=A0A4R2LE26_9GAMM|nr:EF-P beta-lysylation protein EpmB [Plasticicumulans lactativorans]TCO81118.1 L-lysine 2,3-aminomutase [Plasticicumulans lactativorans]
MIAASLTPREAPPRWQVELAAAYTDPAELLHALDLDPAWLPAARRAAAAFPLRVPRGFVARMRKGDAHDPLLRQVLPLAEELVAAPGYVADPVGDLAAMPVPGVLHKYRGRALLVATGACGVHCRYCFRREFPYGAASAGRGAWDAALDYLRATPEVSEVILSGGDPLALSDRRLATLLAALDAIPHLQRLRIHSRQPVVLPARVDGGLLAVLDATRLATVLVVHANHPHELDAEVAAALAPLRRRGITLLNQSVLLAGVNDDAAVLAELSERLFAAGVLPYYLHQLDAVRGAAHFAVADARALAIMDTLRAQLPGYLVPRLVREVAGAPAKTPVVAR